MKVGICRYCDTIGFCLSCDVGKIVTAIATLWKLGFHPPNDHLVFDQVNFDLVNYRRNCDIIKSINMLHFMDVATSFL
jgi:hypothetical protein